MASEEQIEDTDNVIPETSSKVEEKEKSLEDNDVEEEV